MNSEMTIRMLVAYILGMLTVLLLSRPRRC